MPSNTVLYAIGALVVVALIALGIGWSIAAFRGALADAAQAAASARDAHWRAEIESHNARIAAAQRVASEAAARADAIARAADAREAQLQSELEARNAALPDARAPGLSRERVCLISPASCADRNRPPARAR